jgi:hypothetical protein
MMVRAILFSALAMRLFAAVDDPQPIEDTLSGALQVGDINRAEQLFDPSAPALQQIRNDLKPLLTAAEVSLYIRTDTGIWNLTVTARDVSAGVTHRSAKVVIRVEGGLIRSFEPSNFFAPPHGREAWDAVFAFASSLNDDSAPPSLTQFDPAMPGFEAFRNTIKTLWTQFQIEPSLDLINSEGDDTHRTLSIEWTMDLRNQQDPTDATQRDQTVTIRVEKQGKNWRIVALDPQTLFAPAKPKYL